jgi:hypothetical protein
MNLRQVFLNYTEKNNVFQQKYIKIPFLPDIFADPGNTPLNTAYFDRFCYLFALFHVFPELATEFHVPFNSE